ncbi:MAG: hypothetical protein AB1589_10980 [Cyanobacteriota bacterium]
MKRSYPAGIALSPDAKMRSHPHLMQNAIALLTIYEWLSPNQHILPSS